MVTPSQLTSAADFFPPCLPPELQGMVISYLPPIEGLLGSRSPIVSRSSFTGPSPTVNEAWSDMAPLTRGGDFAAKTFQSLRTHLAPWEAAKKTYELLCSPVTGYFRNFNQKFSGIDRPTVDWDEMLHAPKNIKVISELWGDLICLDFFRNALFFNGTAGVPNNWEGTFPDGSSSETELLQIKPEDLCQPGSNLLPAHLPLDQIHDLYRVMADHFRTLIQKPPFPKPVLNGASNFVHIPIEVNQAGEGYLKRWSFELLKAAMNRGQPLAAFRDSLVTCLPQGIPLVAPIKLREDDGLASLDLAPQHDVVYGCIPGRFRFTMFRFGRPIIPERDYFEEYREAIGFHEILFYACTKGLLPAIEEMYYWPKRENIDPLTLAASINQLCFRGFSRCLNSLMKWPEIGKITPQIWEQAYNPVKLEPRFSRGVVPTTQEAYLHVLQLYQQVQEALIANATSAVNPEPKRKKPEQAGPSQASEEPHFEQAASSPETGVNETAAASSAVPPPRSTRKRDERD